MILRTFIIMPTTLQTLGQSLDRWQALYIISITIALLSTFAIVFFAFHKEHRSGLRTSNYIYVLASLLAVISTIVIVNKTKSLDAEKDRASKAKSDANDLEVAKAKREAATANENALRVAQDNIKLSGQISTDAATARAAEAALAKANKDTSDFAHGLQQQQRVMQEQAKLSPQLVNYQIQQLATTLRPYTGKDISLHVTSDTVVARLGAQIKAAFNLAGITTKSYSTDMSALYQGVSVAVHDPKDVPAVANALMFGLRQAGIDAHPVAAPNLVEAGQVGLFIGPN
jgi:hypothetical protein